MAYFPGHPALARPPDQFVVTWVALVIVAASLLSYLLHRSKAVEAWKAGWGIVSWLAFTAAVSRLGLFSTEPPIVFAVFMLSVLVTNGCLMARSSVGAQLATLPFWLLCGVQGFRIWVEVMLHWAYESGFAPQQITYEGNNLDMVTGVVGSALGFCLVFVEDPSQAGAEATALVAEKSVIRQTLPASAAKVAVWIFNVGGLGLLLTVITTAMLSMPKTPWQRYTKETEVCVWILHAPFCWLPLFLAQIAFGSHIVIFRKLMCCSTSQAEDSV